MNGVLLSFGAGALGGALAFLAGSLIVPPQAFAIVDLQQVLAAHITEIGNRQLDKASAQKEATAYGAAVEQSLDELAKEHHTLLLPAPAVLRGAPDLTDALQQRIASHLADSKGGKP